MERYNIALNGAGRIEEILWKFPFFTSLEKAKEAGTYGESIHRIELAPGIIPDFFRNPHMIVIKGRARNRFSDMEKIFRDYNQARNAYIKEELNIGFADVLPVFRVTQLGNNSKKELYKILI